MKAKPPPPPAEADLRRVDLRGRYVELFWEGRRVARVRNVPGRRVLTVEFQARPGLHRVAAETVLGVIFRKKLVPLAEWAASRPLAPEVG